MLVNYLEVIENKNSLYDSFRDDALTLINKCFKLSDMNASLISKTQKWISLMWLTKLILYFDKIEILKECVSSSLITKLKDEVIKLNDDDNY